MKAKIEELTHKHNYDIKSNDVKNEGELMVMRTKNEQLQNTVDSLNQQLNTVTAQYKNAMQELNTVDERISSTNDAQGKLKKIVSQLEGKLRQAESSKKALENKIMEIELKNAEEFRQKSDEQTRLTMNKASAEKVLDEARQEIQKLKIMLETQKSIESDLNTRIEYYMKRVLQWQISNKQATTEVASKILALQNEKQMQENEINKLRREIQEANNREIENRKEIVEKNTEINRLKNAMNENKESNNKEVKLIREEYDKTISSYEGRIQDLEVRLHETEDSLEISQQTQKQQQEYTRNVEDKLSDASDALEQYENQITVIRDQLKDMKSQNSSLEKQMDKDRKELEAKIQRREKEILQLRESLSKGVTKEDDYQREKKRLEKENSKLKSQIETFQSTTDAMSSEVSRLKEKLVNEKEQSAKASEELSELQRKYDDKVKENKSLLASKRATKSAVEDLQHELNRLQSSLIPKQQYEQLQETKAQKKANDLSRM